MSLDPILPSLGKIMHYLSPTSPIMMGPKANNKNEEGGAAARRLAAFSCLRSFCHSCVGLCSYLPMAAAHAKYNLPTAATVSVHSGHCGRTVAMLLFLLLVVLVPSVQGMPVKKVALRHPTGLLLTNPDPITGRVFCLLQQNALRLRPSLARVFTVPSLLAAEHCRRIITAAEEYAAVNEGWTSARHTGYPTTDLPVDAIFPEGRFSAVHGFVNAQVLPLLAARFGLREDRLKIGELFVAKYEAAAGRQRGLAAHRDGTQWSFVLGLNDAAEFDGGGTLFLDVPASGSVSDSGAGDQGGGQGGLLCRAPPGQVGSATLFSGKNLHMGVPLTRGVRYILAGFVDFDCAAWYGPWDSAFDGSAWECVASGDELLAVEGPGGLVGVQGMGAEAIRQAVRASMDASGGADAHLRLLVRPYAAQVGVAEDEGRGEAEQRRVADRAWHAMSVGNYFVVDDLW